MIRRTLVAARASTLCARPVGARRIIKVDDFYVVLQVKAYHFTPPDSPYLDSMTVAVEFTNTDPRAEPEASGEIIDSVAEEYEAIQLSSSK